jgi:hypothetical protein
MRIESEIGPHLEEQAKKNLKKGLPILVITYGSLLLIGLDFSPLYINLGKMTAPIFFVSGIAFMYGLMQFIVPYKYFKMGLSGERQVIANIADKLGAEHSLFNDVMLKDGKAGGNIDHIIVGPRGIFVIETKNFSKSRSVYGDNWEGLKQSPSMQAKINAKRVYFLLNNKNILGRPFPLVHAIVALPNGKSKLEIKKFPEMCEIIEIKDGNDRSLYDYVMSYKEIIFSTEEIGRIVDSLKNFKV